MKAYGCVWGHVGSDVGRGRNRSGEENHILPVSEVATRDLWYEREKPRRGEWVYIMHARNGWFGGGDVGGLHINRFVTLDPVLLQHIGIPLSQVFTFFVMIHALDPLAFGEVVSDDTSFHGLDPRLADVFFTRFQSRFNKRGFGFVDGHGGI